MSPSGRGLNKHTVVMENMQRPHTIKSTSNEALPTLTSHILALDISSGRNPSAFMPAGPWKAWPPQQAHGLAHSLGIVGLVYSKRLGTTQGKFYSSRFSEHLASMKFPIMKVC